MCCKIRRATWKWSSFAIVPLIFAIKQLLWPKTLLSLLKTCPSGCFCVLICPHQQMGHCWALHHGMLVFSCKSFSSSLCFIQLWNIIFDSVVHMAHGLYFKPPRTKLKFKNNGLANNESFVDPNLYASMMFFCFTQPFPYIDRLQELLFLKMDSGYRGPHSLILVLTGT